MIQATLIDHMGDDLRVVNAARVSFDKESEYEKVWCDYCLQEPQEYREDACYDAAADDACEGRLILSERDQKLISYLARHNHWTPFSHAQITLREEVPIFVARQRFKHMVGFTYNEVSRRYVDDEPKLFKPDAWRGRADNAKQGSGEAIELPRVLTGELANTRAACVRLYERLLANGVAPEQARMVLPQSMMTSYYVTGSLAAFARAYRQRIDPHSQKEIQDLAKSWDQIIRPLFPVSWSALVD